LGIEISCVVDAKAELGEGTLWDPGRGVLWWIDIWSKKIHCHDPATGENLMWEAPEYLGCLGLRAKGGLIVTLASGFYFFDPDTAEFNAIADPEEHLPQTRFNDGKTDRQGRFWSGTMFEAPGKPVEFVGSLYRMDYDHSVHKIIAGVGCSNGLAFSPDSKTMYFSDSFDKSVWAFDFDPVTGEIENKRTFIDMVPTGGLADGATVDAEGCYWVTVPVTGKVSRYDPDGHLMQNIMLPTDLPTCCEFGGPDLDILFVTTAVLRRSPKDLKGQLHPGGLFAIDAGVKGLRTHAFAG